MLSGHAVVFHSITYDFYVEFDVLKFFPVEIGFAIYMYDELSLGLELITEMDVCKTAFNLFFRMFLLTVICAVQGLRVVYNGF